MNKQNNLKIPSQANHPQNGVHSKCKKLAWTATSYSYIQHGPKSWKSNKMQQSCCITWSSKARSWASCLDSEADPNDNSTARDITTLECIPLHCTSQTDKRCASPTEKCCTSQANTTVSGTKLMFAIFCTTKAAQQELSSLNRDASFQTVHWNLHQTGSPWPAWEPLSSQAFCLFLKFFMTESLLWCS